MVAACYVGGQPLEPTVTKGSPMTKDIQSPDDGANCRRSTELRMAAVRIDSLDRRSGSARVARRRSPAQALAPGVGPVRVTPKGGVEQETLVLAEHNRLDAPSSTSTGRARSVSTSGPTSSSRPSAPPRLRPCATASTAILFSGRTTGGQTGRSANVSPVTGRKMVRFWPRSLWVATAAVLVASCAPPPGPPVVTTTTSQTGGLTVAAAGDIACDPNDRFFNGGLGDATHCQMNATAKAAAALHPSAVLALGDLQYNAGTTAEFLAVYDHTWGQLKAITHPVPGNHEYVTPGAAGYRSYFGATAAPAGTTWYSFNLGSWHVVALDSTCSKIAGCGPALPKGAGWPPTSPPTQPCARSPSGTTLPSRPLLAAGYPDRSRCGTCRSPAASTSCSTATAISTSASRRWVPAARATRPAAPARSSSAPAATTWRPSAPPSRQRGAPLHLRRARAHLVRHRLHLPVRRHRRQRSRPGKRRLPPVGPSTTHEKRSSGSPWRPGGGAARNVARGAQGSPPTARCRRELTPVGPRVPGWTTVVRLLSRPS